LEQALLSLAIALIAGLLGIAGGLMIERRRESRSRERALTALITETELNLQLLGGINAGELHYTRLESLMKSAAYEQARDAGALADLPEGGSMEIASALFELMVCCDIARRNTSLRFPEETSSGDGYKFKHYLNNAHARLLHVSKVLQGHLNANKRWYRRFL
jgi:hypothetical protein